MEESFTVRDQGCGTGTQLYSNCSHSVLSCIVSTKHTHDETDLGGAGIGAPTPTGADGPVHAGPEIDLPYNKPPRRYKKKKLMDEFMSSPEKIAECADIIDALLRDRVCREKLDSLSESIIKVYTDEMSKFLKGVGEHPKAEGSRSVKWSNFVKTASHIFDPSILHNNTRYPKTSI